MTTGVLNYPRKPLSERERTVREAVSRASSGQDVVHISADQSSTSITLANVTGLYLRVSSGVYYHFKFCCIVRSSVATNGIRVGLTVPSFTRFSAMVQTVFAAAGATSLWTGSITASGGSVIATDVPVADTDYIAVVEGVILPSADGTVQVQLATETAPNQVTMRQASCGILTAT